MFLAVPLLAAPILAWVLCRAGHDGGIKRVGVPVSQTGWVPSGNEASVQSATLHLLSKPRLFWRMFR